MMLWRRSKPAQMTTQGNRHIMPRSVSASGRPSPTGSTIPPCKNLTSFLSLPILFPGCSSKFLFGSDPSMSPTSTLDDRVFVRSSSFGRMAIGLLGVLHDGGNSPGSPNSTSILTAATQMKVNIPSFRRTNSAEVSPADTISSEERNNLISSVSPNGSPPSVRLSGGSELVISLYGAEMGRDDECYEIQPSSEEEEDTDGSLLPLEEAESVCQNSMQSFDEIPVAPRGYHLSPPPSVRVIDASNFVGSLPYSVGSVRRSLSVSDIDLSEGYTRIVDRGPNPKTTHIFGDWVVETCGKGLAGVGSEQHEVGF